MTEQIREQLQATLGLAYTLERELGGGGMSRVFVADEHRLKRKVVVKVLSPELAQGISIERFEREIQTVAALQHANIVPVFTAGDTNGLPFYTMPFVEGESLRARLGRGPMAVTEVISVLRDVSRALAYAHRQGVVHRDIKPDNVLLSEGAAVVTDFGIAKAISASRTGVPGGTLTQIGTSIGTPAYMAPEQAAGDPNVDHRADLYSLGAMAYEMLSGQQVFADRTPQRMLAAHMGEAPLPIAQFRADVPPVLADLVMQCLAKDATHRPPSAGDISRALETITSGSGMHTMPGILLGGAPMFRRALATYAAAFVVVALLAKAAIVGIGLPGWVFPGALIVMALGLPVVLWTGYVQRVARRVGDSDADVHAGRKRQGRRPDGTIATMALKAAPQVSWYRTARGGDVRFRRVHRHHRGVHGDARVRHRAVRIAHRDRQVERPGPDHYHRLSHNECRLVARPRGERCGAGGPPGRRSRRRCRPSRWMARSGACRAARQAKSTLSLARDIAKREGCARPSWTAT